MIRRLLLLGRGGLRVAALAVGELLARSVRKCVCNEEAGVLIHNHVATIIYCGPAKATAKTGGRRPHVRRRRLSTISER